MITLEYPEFFMVTCYTPNSQAELKRLAYRMTWEDAFRAYLNELNQEKPVILCGDLNVAHQNIDLKIGKPIKNAGFTPEERQKFTELLDSGFTDTFRYFYPEAEASTHGGVIALMHEKITQVGGLTISLCQNP